MAEIESQVTSLESSSHSTSKEEREAGQRNEINFSLECSINEHVFLKTMDLFIKELQYFIPPVLRSEIVSDSELNQDHHHSQVFHNDTSQVFRKVHQKIVFKPREFSDMHMLFHFEKTKFIAVDQLEESLSKNSSSYHDKQQQQLQQKQLNERKEILETSVKVVMTIHPEFHSSLVFQNCFPPIINLIFGYSNSRIYIQAVPSTEHNTSLVIDSKHVDKGYLNGYTKRVVHDVIVPKIDFQNKYAQLKSKYRSWVQKWPEKTDPSKFVYEELAIATWLILLWESLCMNTDDSTSLKLKTKRLKFVDVGCGNGFLTFVLTNEGYTGYGFDVFDRKIWSLYPIPVDLRVCPINPKQTTFDNVDWIIGNHSDELTLWIPYFAAQSSYDAKFLIIPCCFYDMTGKKFTNLGHAVYGRYKAYIDHVKSAMSNCGYSIETEHLRIPSTKNIALLGRKRTISINQHAELISRLKDEIQHIEIEATRKDPRENHF